MQELRWMIDSLTPTALLDIFVVAVLFFGVTFVFRGTQAAALMRGILVILLVLFSATLVFRLQALGWLLTNGLTVLAVAIPVIFQPELRRALEQVGRAGIFLNAQSSNTEREQIIHEIVKACERLSERRHGALIVLQRNSGLEEFINTGVALNSAVKAELLLTIFWPKTELHDGAVIIDRSGRIASAAAVLPLSASRNLPNPKMGTRHRAALGISEVSDAICVVVSEESGRISIANGGRIVSKLDPERMRTILGAFYGEIYSQRNQARWRSVLERLRLWAKPSKVAQKQG